MSAESSPQTLTVWLVQDFTSLVWGEACLYLGHATKDKSWWSVACKANHMPSCALYAHNKVNALEALCSSKNNDSSCYNLGILSLTGFVDGTKNYEKASQHFKQACERGHGAACYNMAQLYRRRLIGSPQEQPRKAAEYFSIACENGNSEGCYNIAYLFQHGHGVPRDENLAVQNYRRACEAEPSVVDACFNLGTMVSNVSYFEKACKLGMQDACSYAMPVPQKPDESKESNPAASKNTDPNAGQNV